MQPHRKRIRHYDEPGHVPELTFSCFRREPFLLRDEFCREFCTSLDRAQERHAHQLFAFVIMPEHVRLLVQPSENGSGILELLRAIKRPCSYRIKNSLEAVRDPLLKQLTVQQRPGVQTFRFWQEGPGYDRNLTSSRAIEAAINYIHLNPVRRGLCQRAIDWKWSSARYVIMKDSTDSDLPLFTLLMPEVIE